MLSLLVLFIYSISSVFSYPNIEKHPKYGRLPFEECGESQAPSDRIIGGKTAELGQFPWMARIGYTKKDCRDPVTFRCGGALITKRHVLTAAHCIAHLPEDMCKSTRDFTQYELKVVRLGEHMVATNPDCGKFICADPVKDVSVERIHLHPHFNRPQLRNDIGIIKLAHPINFTDWILPLCMIRGSYVNKPYLHSTAYVAGWGLIDIATGESSTELRYIKVPIVTNDRCRDTYGGRVNLSASAQICAGGVKGQDSCSGDSGGPLAILDDDEHGPKFKLLGIVSFGNTRCAYKPAPAIYTNVLYYANWILDHL